LNYDPIFLERQRKMYYYQHHIGDYRAATAHLTNEEDLAYRRLLDMYYDTEQKIPTDTEWVARRIRMDVTVVESVLVDMFQEEPDGWLHSRCEREIEAFKGKMETASKAGKASAAKRAAEKINARTTTVQLTNNHKPLTNNHKPMNTAPDGVDQKVWEDFVQLRKVKKAAITDTAIKGILREANKAGYSLQEALETCCSRGWVGFKASWVQDAVKTSAKSFAETEREYKQQQYDEMVGRNTINAALEIRNGSN
jgi:uncharacterized protein YdaU (DUF1376 family)